MSTQKQNHHATLTVGIDISKDTFDLAIPISGTDRFAHHKLSNQESGFKELLALLAATTTATTERPHVAMEASGPYYLQLATFLYYNDIPVSVVNPLVIRRFCQMRMVRAKTDKKDAQMIALYAAAESPALWTPQAEGDAELRQMQSTLELLEKQHTALSNHRHAQQQSPQVNIAAGGAIEAALVVLEEQIEVLKKQMAAIAKASYGQSLKLVETIPGIGRKTAIILLSLTSCFKHFSSAKQVSSYFGMCPRIYDSGTSVKGKGRITKMGMGAIRKLLYMCAISASRYNDSCRELYERLRAKGKAATSALIAVANKLLRQAFAVVTTNTAYKP